MTKKLLRFSLLWFKEYKIIAEYKTEEYKIIEI